MPVSLPSPLLLVGAGNMGGALLKGWLQQGLPAVSVVVQDPAPPPAMADMLASHGIACQPGPVTLASAPSVILLAVKPQIMDQVVPGIAAQAGPGTVVLSVAAGRTIASLAKHFKPQTAIVRTIPNTPASIGRGITAATANAHATQAQRALCHNLLLAVGDVVWVTDEPLIDAATAVSGSGPAYVFLLAECLAEAGRAAGLPADVATQLARATVAGAGELLHRSDLPAATLRQNVTSPKGTTAAALDVLMADGGLQALMTRAVAAADRRARELAG
jgi:pyrroline-5-carboxylate reductase